MDALQLLVILAQHVLEVVYKGGDGVLDRVLLDRLGRGHDVLEAVARELLLLERLLSEEAAGPVPGRHVAGPRLEADDPHEERLAAEALRDLDHGGRGVEPVRHVPHLDALPPPREVEASATVEHQVGDLEPLAR